MKLLPSKEMFGKKILDLYCPHPTFSSGFNWWLLNEIKLSPIRKKVVFEKISAKIFCMVLFFLENDVIVCFLSKKILLVITRGKSLLESWGTTFLFGYVLSIGVFEVLFSRTI